MNEATKVMEFTPPPVSVCFYAGANNEMLRVSPDGFYVRGLKLEQDANEARALYNALAAWLEANGYPLPSQSHSEKT